jgi:hypothetical protein
MANKKFIVKNGLQSDGNVLINKALDNAVDQLQIDGSTSVTGQIKSTLATGTAPFSVSSTTAVTNLNADLLDGQEGSYFLDAANFTGTLPNNFITLGTQTTGNYVATVAGTTNEIEVTGSGSETSAVTIGLPDDVVITSSLTVNGSNVLTDSDTGSGNALDADTVDGIQGASLLRSDTSDNYTSGTLTFNSGTTVGFASGATVNFDNTTGTAPFTVDSTTVVTNLNADLLDGQQGTYYLDWTNTTNKPDPVITLAGDLSGSVTLTDLASGTLTATIVANAVALGSDTTGSYVATIAGTANEIEVSGSGSETAAVTIGLPNDVTVSGDLTVGGYVAGPATFTIDPAAVGDDTGTVVIAGNLTVNGTTTTVNSNTVEIGDAILTLNSDETGAPSQNAGLEVERGTSANVFLRWNEATDVWEITEDGSNYYSILTSNDAITISDGSTTQDVNMGETLTFADGTDIDVVVSATNTLTVNHNVAGANTTISSTTNTFVDEITVTAQGHVTSVATTAIDFNVADNYAFKTFTDGSNSAVADSNTDTFTFNKTDQIEVTVSAAGDSLTIGHADSGVSAASYGSSTAIPIITVDAQGHVTAVSTAAISTSWTISDGSTTQSIDGGDTLTVSGTANEVEVAVSATDTLTVGLPNDVTVSNDLTVGNDVILDNHRLQSITQTTTATTQVNLATFSTTTYAGAEVNIMAISNGERHITKLLITHDGTTAYATEYGEIVTNASLASYDVDINTGNLRVRVTPASATSTVFNTSVMLIEN